MRRRRRVRWCTAAVSTNGSAEPEAAVRHQQRRAETRQPVAVTDLDADAVDHRVQHQVLEVRVAAELVDRVAAVEPSPHRVDERVGREQPVGVDPVVRDCARPATVGLTCPLLALRAEPLGLMPHAPASRTVAARHPAAAGERRDARPRVQVGHDLLGRDEVARARAPRPRACRRRPGRPGRARARAAGPASPASSATRAGHEPRRTHDGHRDPVAEAHGLPRARRTRTDDVERALGAAHDRLEHRGRGVVGVQQLERRVGERRHRHGRQPQQATDRARRVRPGHRRQPQTRRPGCRGGGRAGGVRLDLEADAPVRVVGSSGACSSGTSGRPGPRP